MWPSHPNSIFTLNCQCQQVVEIQHLTFNVVFLVKTNYTEMLETVLILKHTAVFKQATRDLVRISFIVKEFVCK